MTGPDYFIAENGDDTFEWAVGNYFQIKFPDIPRKQRYSFSYEAIESPDFFQKYDYDAVEIAERA